MGVLIIVLECKIGNLELVSQRHFGKESMTIMLRGKIFKNILRMF